MPQCDSLDPNSSVDAFPIELDEARTVLMDLVRHVEVERVLSLKVERESFQTFSLVSHVGEPRNPTRKAAKPPSFDATMGRKMGRTDLADDFGDELAQEEETEQSLKHLGDSARRFFM